MDKPAVVGVDHAEPGTDCSVYASVINADHGTHRIALFRTCSTFLNAKLMKRSMVSP
jgi:hypothetical protein